MIRPDAASAVAACYAALECDMSDDPCFSATGLDLEPSEGAADYASACSMRREECGAAFSDDLCFFDLAADGVYDDLAACLENECDAIAGCLVDIVTCE